MTKISHAGELNRTLLAGTPYCLAEDPGGEAQALEMLDIFLEIRGLQAQADRMFKSNLESVRLEVEETLDIRLVFESNAIEDVPTSFAETRNIITANPASADFLPAYTFGKGVGADPRVMEVIGHRDAVLFARQLATSYGGVLREADLRDLHRLVMASEPRIAGRYKTFQNKISGRANFLTTHPAYVSEEVHNLLTWMSVTLVRNMLVHMLRRSCMPGSPTSIPSKTVMAGSPESCRT